jgi:hypothetical protein
MIKESEHRRHRGPQKTLRKNEIQTNRTLSFCEEGGLQTQAVTNSSLFLQLSFLCVLCGISVSSVFLLFQLQLVHG